MQAAFITYNRVGSRGSMANGWIDGQDGRKAFVLQHDWTNQPGAILDMLMSLGTGSVRRSIEGMFQVLGTLVQQLDKVVIYVGSLGSEKAIELAKVLPPEKVVFVLCSCGTAYKHRLIQQAGLSAAQQIACECGGDDEMGQLLENFLSKGAISL